MCPALKVWPQLRETVVTQDPAVSQAVWVCQEEEDPSDLLDYRDNQDCLVPKDPWV